MTTDELRAAAGELVRLHERFAPMFGRKEARAHSLVYLNGLLLSQDRKSAEPMALVFGEPDDEDGIGQNQVLGLQRFLTHARWNSQDIQREIQQVFAEELVPSTANWSIGTVGVIDGSGFPKKGTESVGVQRQYCGRLGKTENCQVGVFLTGVTPAGTALLDCQLYLPKDWASDYKRRKKVRVPKEIRFCTQPQIAAELLQRTQETGAVRFDWVIADEAFGSNGSFLDTLEERQQKYLFEVPANTTVWTMDPATEVPAGCGIGRPRTRPRRDAVCSVKAVAESLPANAWHALQVRAGACGPLVFEFAAMRAWSVRHRKAGPPIWLMIRRSLGADPEIKYYVSNAAAETRLETLALVSGCRFRVEEFLEEGKSYLGMAQYESRAWSSWHHHMSLVALAHLFVTLTRERLKKSPTLDLGHGAAITKERAAAIAAYYLRRHQYHGVPLGSQPDRTTVPH
jgi:SRSO17 transposase